MNQIAQGEIPITHNMLGDVDEFFTSEEMAGLDLTQAVPLENFWLKQLKAVPVIDELIHNKDEPCLKHLQNIALKINNESDDFSLEFQFSENEYFNNNSLEVTIIRDKK